MNLYCLLFVFSLYISILPAVSSQDLTGFEDIIYSVSDVSDLGYCSDCESIMSEYPDYISPTKTLDNEAINLELFRLTVSTLYFNALRQKQINDFVKFFLCQNYEELVRLGFSIPGDNEKIKEIIINRLNSLAV
jgi:hypothetical protein